jgi:hypothetical protein
MGIASRIPFDLVQKLQADMPKIQQLMALEKQAVPHLTALEPIAQEAQAVWNSISPDVTALITTVEKQP